MFCPQCGKELPDGSKFCAGCGKTLGDISAASGTTPAPSQAASESTVAAAIHAATGGKPKSKKPLIIGAIAVVAVIAVVVVALNLTGAFTKGQNAETFKAQLEQNSFVKNGVASSAYLNDSAYKLTKYSCNDIKVTKDPTFGADIVTATIDATIENDNYITEAKITGTYSDTQGTAAEKYVGVVSNYSFNVVSSTTTPKKGIDYDSALKLENCNSELSEDKKSCFVKQEKTTSFWFGDSSENMEYTFTFDGTKWVEPKQTDPIHTVVYKNLDGNYAAKTGTLTSFTKFTVSNVDAAKGTFTIDYAYTKEKTLATDGGDITGTMTATIEPKTSSWGSTAMEDGYVYYFEAKGNSTGGNGQANLKGHFAISDSGEDTIQVESMSLDLPSKYSFGSSASGYGPLFKQATA